jgi:hypothetical protein
MNMIDKEDLHPMESLAEARPAQRIRTQIVAQEILAIKVGCGTSASGSKEVPYGLEKMGFPEARRAFYEKRTEPKKASFAQGAGSSKRKVVEWGNDEAREILA